MGKSRQHPLFLPHGRPAPTTRGLVRPHHRTLTVPGAMPVVELVGADRFPLLQIKPIPPGGNRDITELPQLVFPLSGPFKYPGHGINRSVGPLQLVQKIQIPAALGQNRHTVSAARRMRSRIS